MSTKNLLLLAAAAYLAWKLTSQPPAPAAPPPVEAPSGGGLVGGLVGAIGALADWFTTPEPHAPLAEFDLVGEE